MHVEPIDLDDSIASYPASRRISPSWRSFIVSPTPQERERQPQQQQHHSQPPPQQRHEMYENDPLFPVSTGRAVLPSNKHVPELLVSTSRSASSSYHTTSRATSRSAGATTFTGFSRSVSRVGRGEEEGSARPESPRVVPSQDQQQQTSSSSSSAAAAVGAVNPSSSSSSSVLPTSHYWFEILRTAAPLGKEEDDKDRVTPQDMLRFLKAVGVVPSWWFSSSSSSSSSSTRTKGEGHQAEAELVERMLQRLFRHFAREGAPQSRPLGSSSSSSSVAVSSSALADVSTAASSVDATAFHDMVSLWLPQTAEAAVQLLALAEDDSPTPRSEERLLADADAANRKAKQSRLEATQLLESAARIRAQQPPQQHHHHQQRRPMLPNERSTKGPSQQPTTTTSADAATTYWQTQCVEWQQECTLVEEEMQQIERDEQRLLQQLQEMRQRRQALAELHKTLVEQREFAERRVADAVQQLQQQQQQQQQLSARTSVTRGERLAQEEADAFERNAEGLLAEAEEHDATARRLEQLLNQRRNAKALSKAAATRFLDELRAANEHYRRGDS